MKTLSLFFASMTIAALGCSSRGVSSSASTPVSPSAPSPLSVERPEHAPPMTGGAAPGGGAIDPGATDPAPVREAVAVLVPTQGSHVSGVVRFRDDGDSVAVVASIDNLPARVHAYHVHVYGDCSSPDASSAGPHFNFSGSSFAEATFITGNLGELRPGAHATTLHRVHIPATLDGPFSIIGRAVVVHEKGNDHASPPDGAAGKRLACGVIGVARPFAGAPATAHHAHHAHH
ncbi:MAG TPA: superoxide dismutase family protein [Kofleriaceae bacterium]|nr:superoxide dismutase family protein [Kofleriaceae bacterium]